MSLFEFSDYESPKFLDFGVVDSVQSFSTSDMPTPRLHDEELTVRDPEWAPSDPDLVLRDEKNPLAYYERYGLHAEVLGSRVVEATGVECLIEKRSPDTN